MNCASAPGDNRTCALLYVCLIRGGFHMRNHSWPICVVLLVIAFNTIASNDKQQANSYDDAWESAWVTHCRSILSGGTGKTAGFVLEVGDSITHANPYSQWPRYGSGKTSEDTTLCNWAQTG